MGRTRWPSDPLTVLGDRLLIGDGCWEWLGFHNAKGYSQVRIGGRGGRLHRLHRLLYELLIGPIPDGLQLDHLCRNRGCVRPDHLEPVTQEENLARGNPSPTDINRMKVHCPAGHPYDAENTYYYPRSQHRGCRECNRERGRVHRG